MEVQARTLVPQLVVDIDDQPIANVAFDSGNRPAPIDTDGWSFKLSCRICRHPGNIEIILDDGRMNRACQ